MKPLTIDDIYRMHREKFGVEPVITGVNFFDSCSIPEKILEAIETGEPYVEEEVPPGVDI